jgi:D-glycero-alpha-D-manno-heptose-7-phosphate kinase
VLREALRLTDTTESLTVTIRGDVPAGTGLGSSSSLTVGLLNALYTIRGEAIAPGRLAREACQIEVGILNRPIGYQDQYAAAFGGLNFMRFRTDGTVIIERVVCNTELEAELDRRLLLFFTGTTRGADEILSRQSAATESGRCVATLRSMRDLAHAMRSALSIRDDINEFGRLLHESWCLKRSLGFGISCRTTDDWYAAARAAGAQGGKLLGAGGGGYLLIMAPPEAHGRIRAALGRPPELPFRIARSGSQSVAEEAPRQHVRFADEMIVAGFAGVRVADTASFASSGGCG